MQDILERLLTDHAELRRLLSEMVAILGLTHGVGDEDQTDLDIHGLKAIEKNFSMTLKMHEDVEERFLSRMFEKLELEDRLRVEALAIEHQTIEEVFQLLASVSSLCDGRHVHALRSVISSLTYHMERHLDYEERELFPMLKRIDNFVETLPKTGILRQTTAKCENPSL